MPSVRTPKSNVGKNAGTLAVFGFLPTLRKARQPGLGERRSKPEDEVATAALKPDSAGALTAPTSFETPVSDAAATGMDDEDSTPKKPAPINAFKRLKDAAHKGIRHATFDSKLAWERFSDAHLGSTTQYITFRTGFSLKPEHFDFIISRPALCQKLLHFEFCYDDVSEDPTDEKARNVTDECIVRLAEACPKLRTFKLQGYYSCNLALCVEALGKNCPDLSMIDISDAHLADDSVFEVLYFNPDLLPALKTLRLAQLPYGSFRQKDKTKIMKTMRGLSKDRKRLLIQLVTKDEEKVGWGWSKYWHLNVRSDDYKNGRKYEPPAPRPEDMWDNCWY